MLLLNISQKDFTKYRSLISSMNKIISSLKSRRPSFFLYGWHARPCCETFRILHEQNMNNFWSVYKGLIKVIFYTNDRWSTWWVVSNVLGFPINYEHSETVLTYCYSSLIIVVKDFKCYYDHVMSSLIAYSILMFNRWKIIWPKQGMKNAFHTIKKSHPFHLCRKAHLCRHWVHHDSCRVVFFEQISKCANGKGRWRDYLRYQRLIIPISVVPHQHHLIQFLV